MSRIVVADALETVLRLMSRHANAARSTGPRPLVSTASDRIGAAINCEHRIAMVLTTVSSSSV